MTTSRLALVRDLDFEEDLPRDSFTMAVSRQDFPGVGLGRDAILIRPQIDGGPAVMGSARAVSAGISTTVDRVVRIQGIHRLERPLPMGTLMERLPKQQRTAIGRVSRDPKRITLLPEGLSRNLRVAIEELLGSGFFSATAPLRDRIGSAPGHTILEDQLDAVSTALRCSGMELGLLDAATPTAHPHSVLATLQPPGEVHLIQHDATNTWPQLEQIADMPVHEYVFRDRGNTLHVMNVNALPVETATGVDLLYFNQRYGSFVGVQYKRAAEGRDRDVLCAIDQRLISQMGRMAQFDDLGAGEGVSPANGYRWLQASTFVKFAHTDAAATRVSGLVDGPYVPANYLKHLLDEGKLVGPRGGQSVTYDNLQRWMPKTIFAQMVQYGWAGSTGLTQLALAEWIETEAPQLSCRRYTGWGSRLRAL